MIALILGIILFIVSTVIGFAINYLFAELIVLVLYKLDIANFQGEEFWVAVGLTVLFMFFKSLQSGKKD